MPSRENLAEFTTWCQNHITGDEKGRPPIFLEHLFQAFHQPGPLDVGGPSESCVRKADLDGKAVRCNFNDLSWRSQYPSLDSRNVA